MKAWLKSKTSDRFLLPVRQQMLELLEKDSTLIDMGCGTGDFLRQASPKIKYGLGIDASAALIDFANKQAQKARLQNLEFQLKKITPEYHPQKHFDFATACLFFHVLPWKESVKILQRLATFADELLICAFSKPQSKQQKFLCWLDQRFASHYKNFQEYQRKDYMEGIIESSQLKKVKTFDTFDPVLKIYWLKKQKKITPP